MQGRLKSGRPETAMGPPQVQGVLDIETDQGYPTEQGISGLRAHRFDPRDAARFLVVDLPRISARISCCSVSVDRIEGVPGGSFWRVGFATGGWSGAEELVSTMLGHFWIRQCQVAWERGGWFQFEVPARQIDIAPSEGARMPWAPSAER